MSKNEKLNEALWVKSYADFLFNFAFQRVNDEDTANDLVQETFLSGLEKAHTFEGKCSELTWLRVILSNKIIDYYRKQSSGLNALLERRDDQQGYEDCFDDDNYWVPLRAPQEIEVTGHDKIAVKEFYGSLDGCMRKLPALWMSVFKMKHLDEEKSEVICQELRISTSNYWVIVHRAKLSLRECLQNHWL
jgi:RNA polymerase sigma-70 factor (ECF subfamily)